MKKTYENYDKLTAGDVIVDKLKVFGLGIAGAILCSIPYFVLLSLNISSIALFILTGMGATVFYAALGKKDGKNIFDHLILIIATLIATFLVFCISYLTHYAPMWTLDGREDMTSFEKLAYALTHAKFDYFEGGKLVTDSGTFSVFTMIIAAVIFAIVGIYIAFIFVAISNKKEKK